jgi:hypothetical protein
MNGEVFKAIMQPLLESNQSADKTVYSEIMSKAYACATVGYAGTTFGARLISGDTAFLQQCINDCMDANFADKTREVGEQSYRLMAVGFMGYWASAKFTPVPIAPQMSTTVKGPVVEYPGTSTPFGYQLWYSYSLGYPDAHLDALCAVIKEFQRTLTGKVEGLTSDGKPITLPWQSII